jgi:OmpA-OmpF porin, OOP family
MIQSTIQASVQSAMTAMPGQSITTVADGRDITLTGEVSSEEIKAKAGAAALLVPGVRMVDNRLRVGANPEVVQTKLNELLLKKKIEFETAKDTILASSTPVLNEALKILTEAPGINITVGGHTDNQGDAAANRSLSQRRAQAVVEWFAGHGIARTRMKASGFGPDKPIASNATDTGRAQNRRVEIIADRPALVQGGN